MLRFDFALSPRVQAFLDIKKAIRILQQAHEQQSGYMFLLAAADLRISILGEAGKKSALPEITALFEATILHFQKIAQEHPQYSDDIQHVCDKLEFHLREVQKVSTMTSSFFSNNALLGRYSNALKKQDFIGHNILLPETIALLWKHQNFDNILMDRMMPIATAVFYLDKLLSDYTPWSTHIAIKGCDVINLDRKNPQGLLMIGISKELIEQGFLPDVVASRLTARIRFQNTSLVETEKDQRDHTYQRMLIPVS
ncbi:MAG: hypothetical protein HQM07_08295 [Zetaproteobacteria bacterium]|nr:hypothetical protein [Zetaproteobacteria bacterium]